MDAASLLGETQNNTFKGYKIFLNLELQHRGFPRIRGKSAEILPAKIKGAFSSFFFLPQFRSRNRCLSSPSSPSLKSQKCIFSRRKQKGSRKGMKRASVTVSGRKDTEWVLHFKPSRDQLYKLLHECSPSLLYTLNSPNQCPGMCARACVCVCVIREEKGAGQETPRVEERKRGRERKEKVKQR